MASSTHASTAFARALGEAIAQSGYSLNDCVTMLAEHGVGTTAATLSYWRSGQSLPFRKASKRAVLALEEILQVPTGTLTRALKTDIEESSAAARANAGSNGNVPQNSDTEVLRNFGGIDASIDWEDEAIREILEEEVRVSADFRTVTSRITILARVPNLYTSPALHVSSFWNRDALPSPDDIGVYQIEGATVGETLTEVMPEGVSKTTTLHLPTTLPPNTLHRVYYEQGYFNLPEPVTVAALRAFSWPLRFYTARLTFEGELPASVEWRLSKTDPKGSYVQQVITSKQLRPINKTVQASIENISNAVSSFTWAHSPSSGIML